MSVAKDIIEWYDRYEPEIHGLEPLIKARRRLAIACTEIAGLLKTAEIGYYKAYQLRKLKERDNFLSSEGTGIVRERSSMEKGMRLEEARLEGEKRGIKHILDSYYKVLDSMASQINVLNR
jgi:hypothetical protein